MKGKNKMDMKRVTSALLGFPLVLIILLIGNKIVVDIALSIIVAILLIYVIYKFFIVKTFKTTLPETQTETQTEVEVEEFV